MIYGHPSQTTPMPSVDYSAFNRLSETEEIDERQWQVAVTQAQGAAERDARRQAHEANPTTWLRRIYWLLWGVIVPPQLVLGVWLVLQLLA